MALTRTPQVRARTAILAAVTIVLGLATALTPAPPASAGKCKKLSVTQTCPDTWGKPPTKPNPEKPKTPQKPKTPKGGGGDTSPPAHDAYEVWYDNYATYYFPAQPPAQLRALGASRRSGVQPYYNAKCAGTTKWGKYLGVKTAQGGWILMDGNAEGSGAPKETRQIFASYTCIDPPHYTDTVRDCAATVGATLVGPTGNPDAKQATTSFGPAKSPFAASGNKNLSLCDDAFMQAFPAEKNVMGKYKLTGNGRQIPCTIRRYTTKNAKTGITPRDEIVSCGSEFPYMHEEVKWQLWCGGYNMFWDNKHTFTMDECKATNKWNCGPNFPKAPTYGGVTVPAAGIGVLDDGLKRAAKWVVPKPTGTPKSSLTNVGSGPNAGTKLVTLEFDEHSTPFRTTADVNGPRQPFVASPGLNSPLRGWNDTWNIGFYAPGLPNKNWVVTPTWLFAADFKMNTFSSVTVDWRTGVVTPTKPVPNWVKTSGSCLGAPLSLSVNRARNYR